MINVNSRNPLSFGQLMVTGDWNWSYKPYTKETLPKTLGRPEQMLAAEILNEHSGDKSVDELDKKGFDVQYEVNMDGNQDTFDVREKVSLIKKRDSEKIPCLSYVESGTYRPYSLVGSTCVERFPQKVKKILDVVKMIRGED